MTGNWVVLLVCRTANCPLTGANSIRMTNLGDEFYFCFTPLKGEIHTSTSHTTTKMRKLKDPGDCTLQTKA